MNDYTMKNYVIKGIKVEAHIDPIVWTFVVPSYLDELDAGRAMHIEAKRLADNVERTAYERFKRSYELNKKVE